ncbi:hypothetical protein C8R45DRAFT_1006060 [Mycena sanguinolenta]|nr:hypothetical protein C8R45DRAFT_1006060 [Mycena sanguinolenta]
MPAMAKLMRMKGHNALHPCRACKITGIRDVEEGGKTLYLPLYREDDEGYDGFNLPLRTHNEFIRDAVHVASAPSDAEAKRCSKSTGINGLPILATLSSLSFPDSFPHDLMHLIPENVVSNLITLLTGDFKGIEDGKEDYKLQPAVINAIGDACVVAGNTTPAAFGARVPNLATERHYYTAESYTIFTMLLGPVLLRNRFSKLKYYKHFLELVSIFNDCLKMSIDRDYVDTVLRGRIVEWVELYEKYYYRYEASRLPVCVLTLHALLHIPDDILNAGPMWCYWNYVTERYVGFIARSSKSRKNPYASFARCIRDIAQNTAIKLKYNLHQELDLSDRHDELQRGRCFADYPDISVLKPHLVGQVVPQVRKAVKNFILRSFDVSADEAARFWGKIAFLNGGDTIHAGDLVQQSEHNMTRDASFLKVISSDAVHYSPDILPVLP